MPNLVIGATYKSRVFCFSGNQASINTRYFSPTSLTGAPQSESAFAAALDLLFQSLYVPLLCNVARYIGSDIQNVTGSPPYPVQLGTNANAANGTGGATPLPGQVSGIYTVTTAFAGKGFRGRQYIPFPSTAFSTIGPPPLMTGAYQDLLANLAIETVAGSVVDVGGSSYSLLWVLRHSEPELLAGSITPTANFKVGVNWATIRRRGDFGRPNPQPLP